MMRNYYYLVASFPELLMDLEKKDFSVNALKAEAKENIHPLDYQLIEFLHLPYDNENFLNQILKRGFEFNELGTFDKTIFDEIDENISQLPEYMQDFYYQYTGKVRYPDMDIEPIDEDEKDTTAIEKHPESAFQEKFFEIALKSNNQFISQWFSFIRDFNNILAAINCRRLGVDPAKHLVGNYPLTEILAKSNASDFGLKREIEYFDKLLLISEIQDVLERERRFDLLKWDMATELTTWDYFNINFILSFFIKAGIINRWLKLDAKIGEGLFKHLYEDLKNTYNVANSLQS